MPENRKDLRQAAERASCNDGGTAGRPQGNDRYVTERLPKKTAGQAAVSRRRALSGGGIGTPAGHAVRNFENQSDAKDIFWTFGKKFIILNPRLGKLGHFEQFFLSIIYKTNDLWQMLNASTHGFSP